MGISRRRDDDFATGQCARGGAGVHGGSTAGGTRKWKIVNG
ncbi:hypothetical protein [Streptomyces sp. NPDC058291]